MEKQIGRWQWWLLRQQQNGGVLRGPKIPAVKTNAASTGNRSTLLWRWGRRKTGTGTQRENAAQLQIEANVGSTDQNQT
jgi:hypothetical protein